MNETSVSLILPIDWYNIIDINQIRFTDFYRFIDW